MKITIQPDQPEPTSSIIEPVPIELDGYTILAGKNNSGKTNIVNAIINNQNDIEELKNYHIIFIPADRIQPDQELKNSAKSDPFYSAIADLMEPIFDTSMMNKLKLDFKNENKKLVKSVNKLLAESGVKDTELDIKLEDINTAVAIKLAKAFAKDLYPNATDEIELSKIGTGAQRMIIAALTRYYAESKAKKPNPDTTLLILEEPELCLHPKWKEELFKSLTELVGGGVKVLITTHDPYFITLGKDQKIYYVRRNSKTGATEVEERKESSLLEYRSHAEINYIIFEVPSPTYFLELYERLLSLFSKQCLKCPNPKYGEELDCSVCGGTVEWPKQESLNAWAITNKDGKIGSIRINTKGSKPVVTDTRNKLGHPEDNKISDKEIDDGIKELSAMIPAKQGELK